MAAEEGRIDDAAIAMLEERQRALAEAARFGDVGALVEADMQLHLSLSALAGDELLLEHLAAIHMHSRRLLVYSDLYDPDFGAVVARHARLVDVIRGGDPDTIERAVSEHITEVGQSIVEKMSAAPSGRSEPVPTAS
jgi:DNA-binding GntR family transcriptional regulator